MPHDEEEEEEDFLEVHRRRPEPLPAEVYQGVWSKAYTLLVGMVTDVGWDEMLEVRARVFLMKEDVDRSSKGDTGTERSGGKGARADRDSNKKKGGVAVAGSRFGGGEKGEEVEKAGEDEEAGAPDAREDGEVGAGVVQESAQAEVVEEAGASRAAGAAGAKGGRNGAEASGGDDVGGAAARVAHGERAGRSGSGAGGAGVEGEGGGDGSRVRGRRDDGTVVGRSNGSNGTAEGREGEEADGSHGKPSGDYLV